MVQERRGSAPAEEPRQTDLRGRRIDQVVAADHEVHTLAQVVHDDAQRVRPVASAVADGQVTGRGDLAGA